MNWKTKARIQKMISLFPPYLGERAYYFLQKNFGSLQMYNPEDRLSAGAKIMNSIRNYGQDPIFKTFLEIGTGMRLNVPISLWLCGADKIITIDKNLLLKPEMIFEDISYMRSNQERLRNIFGEYYDAVFFQERFNKLINTEFDMDQLFELMNISFLAPADAREVDLPDGSVDYCISYTVLEHIPVEIINGILAESKRLLKKDGLLIHVIDFTDHFSHSDSSISSINFLQFSEREWKRYSGNRFSNHNRLRLDDFKSLFIKKGLNVSIVSAQIDERALHELEGGFPLDKRFLRKCPENICTRNAFIIASFT